MKALYLKALELLKEVPAIKYADLDKGQLEDYEGRPSLIFPCALIAIEYPRCENIVGKKQKVQARLTLRVAFNLIGRTGSNVPAPVVDQSLEFIDVMDQLYNKFQDYYGEGFSRFGRVSLLKEKRNDGLTVMSLPFATTFVDG